LPDGTGRFSHDRSRALSHFVREKAHFVRNPVTCAAATVAVLREHRDGMSLPFNVCAP
jgi:hypothetical protein